MTMTHKNDKGPRKEGRKEDDQGKEDNQGKQGRLPMEERKITKASKEVNQRMEGR